MNEFDPMLGGLHIVDIGVAVILLISAILGLVRGFTRELFSILAWVGAAAVSYFAYPYVQPWLNQLIDIELLSELGSAIGVFVIAMIVLSLIFSALADRLKGKKTGALDRSLGFLYGLARGGVVVVLAYLILVWFVPPQEQWPWLASARSMPAIQNAGLWTQEEFPETWDWITETLGRPEPDLQPDEGLDPDSAADRLSDPPTAPRDGGEQPQYDGESGSRLNDIIEGFQRNQGGDAAPSQ